MWIQCLLFVHESLFHIGLWKAIFCTLLHFDMSVFGICDVYLFRFTTWRTENMSQHKPQSAVSSPRTYFKHHFLWRVDSIIVFLLLLWCLLCLLSCCCVLMCLVLKTLHMFVYISYINIHTCVHGYNRLVPFTTQQCSKSQLMIVGYYGGYAQYIGDQQSWFMNIESILTNHYIMDMDNEFRPLE